MKQQPKNGEGTAPESLNNLNLTSIDGEEENMMGGAEDSLSIDLERK